MLSEAAIRAAKPKEKAYKLFDERGLYLLVSTKGTRLWRFKYRIAGREKLISLGLYPDVSLKRAREKRDEARTLVSDQKDPSVQRKAAKKAAKTASSNTFKAIAEDFLTKKCGKLADETRSILRARLVNVLYPAVGSREFASIEPEELLEILRRVEARGNHESAHRLRSLFSRVARYAIATGRAKHDISGDLRGALVPVETTHFASITAPAKVGELLRAIDGYQGHPSTHYALKLAPYVFVRPGELRHAEWCEFEVDGDEPTWRIPAARMKMRIQHLVPLSRQVVALLRELQTITGDGRLLLPGLSSSTQPISENSMNAALRRLGYAKDEMTSHGFRSTASTNLNEQGWNADWIEAQLAHSEQDEVRGAYNYAKYLPDRRRMMQAWADYLDKLKNRDNVVPIKRASVA